MSEIILDDNSVQPENTKQEPISEIILGDNSAQPENTNHELKNENTVKPNLFQGRTEAEKGNAKFPDWDIVPPSQFINPRIKPQ